MILVFCLFLLPQCAKIINLKMMENQQRTKASFMPIHPLEGLPNQYLWGCCYTEAIINLTKKTTKKRRRLQCILFSHEITLPDRLHVPKYHNKILQCSEQH